MSLLYFNGFDFLTTDLLLQSAVNYSGYGGSSTTRYSYGHSVSDTSSGSGNFIEFKFADANITDNIIFGVAFMIDSPNLEYWNGVWFLGLTDYNRQFGIIPETGGVLRLRQKDYSTTPIIDESSGGRWIANTWHYLEGKFSVTDSSSYEIRLDGETIMSGSGADLQYSAIPGACRIQLMGSYTGVVAYWDDLYICDENGSKNNDFLGEVVVRTLLPSGAGTYTQWTPSAGSNYENVDEESPDEDTTYNETGVLDNQDSFAMGNLPDSQVTIHGVKTRAIARKEGAGFRALKNFVVVNSSKYNESKDALNLEYDTKYGSVLEENPDDSQDWEVADIDAMEVGVQLAAVQSTTTTTV